jgi:uncharacterized protein YukE
MRVALLLAAAGAAVLLAAGCGGSSSSSSSGTTTTVSPTAWADGLCTALATYKNAVTSAATSVKENGVSEKSLKHAVDSVSSATKTFGDDLKALDAPSTKAGESAQKTVSTLATKVQTEADTVRAAVSNGTPTLSLISTIQTALAQTRSALRTATTQLQQLDASNELRSALTNTPSCKPFFG